MQGLSREGQLHISGNAPEASLGNDCFKCPTLTIGFLRRRVGRFDLKIQFRRVLVEEGGAAADHVGLIFDSFVIENFDGLLQCSYVPSPCNNTQPSLFGLKVACSPVKLPKLRSPGPPWSRLGKYSDGWALGRHMALVQDRLFPNARKGESIGQAGAVDAENFEDFCARWRDH